MLTVIAKREQCLFHASSLIALAAFTLQRYNFFFQLTIRFGEFNVNLYAF